MDASGGTVTEKFPRRSIAENRQDELADAGVFTTPNKPGPALLTFDTHFASGLVHVAEALIQPNTIR
ncbi:hypothetical protein QT381_02705 [Galbitalea sp. SE-J8]|uniref:hypothetical protein n=1 Tax=Galbitalea sp. SE-J8 TaxID=3054952 RepID=UPI00259D26B5|nr:hypothetical protein [Galbitalea sp. SE-J8]MDM4761914.1 hypothetical protein [Galbitalea sp. SE-J8]